MQIASFQTNRRKQKNTLANYNQQHHPRKSMNILQFNGKIPHSLSFFLHFESHQTAKPPGTFRATSRPRKGCWWSPGNKRVVRRSVDLIKDYPKSSGNSLMKLLLPSQIASHLGWYADNLLQIDDQLSFQKKLKIKYTCDSVWNDFTDVYITNTVLENCWSPPIFHTAIFRFSGSQKSRNF